MLGFIADANNIQTHRSTAPRIGQGNQIHPVSYYPVTGDWQGLEERVDLTQLTNGRKAAFAIWGLSRRQYVRRTQPDVLHAQSATGAGWLGVMPSTYLGKAVCGRLDGTGSRRGLGCQGDGR